MIYIRQKYKNRLEVYPLKALFNDVSTLNNLRCMALRSISVFDKVSKWSPEKIALQKASSSASHKMKIDKWPDLPHSFSPIDCCVRINHKPCSLFIACYSVIYILIVTQSLINFCIAGCLLIYLNIIIQYISKFYFFLYRASTMLNNVFKCLPSSLHVCR